MFRKIILSASAMVVLLGVMASPACAQAEGDDVFPEKVQKDLMESVVRIKATSGTSAWQGSGVCVAYNRQTGLACILTAAHVVKDAKSLSFEVFTSASYPNAARKYSPQAEWWYNEKDDIAVVVARIWVPRTATLAKDVDAIGLGDHVLSVGCGIGAPPVAQVGNILGVHEEGDYIVDRGSIAGRSGGPLIGRQGVIGILSHGRNGETVFVSLDKIHGLLQRTAAKMSEEK
jgi:S1-C subfamily serine protease